MTDAMQTLLDFCERHDVGPWVTDDLGCHVLVQDWAERFLHEHALHAAGDAEADVERVDRIRAVLDEKPDRKTISVTKIREALDD